MNTVLVCAGEVGKDGCQQCDWHWMLWICVTTFREGIEVDERKLWAIPVRERQCWVCLHMSVKATNAGRPGMFRMQRKGLHGCKQRKGRTENCPFIQWLGGCTNLYMSIILQTRTFMDTSALCLPALEAICWCLILIDLLCSHMVKGRRTRERKPSLQTLYMSITASCIFHTSAFLDIKFATHQF